VLIVIGLYFFRVIDFHQTVVLYLIALISPTILFFLSLIYNKQLFLKPDLAFIDKKMSREMLDVGFFGILASFSGVLVLNIDTIMVERMLGLSAAGIYSITFFFGTLILIPLRTMGKISSVVIADAWKKSDLDTIEDIYKKSSISLSILGILLFVGIWGNIDNVFILLQADYLPGKMVIFYIGIANLFDIALGVSPHIIVNSKYYRSLSFMLIGFAIFLVVTNLILIPQYGIIGAAIASLISKFVFSVTKFVFIYKKFGIQPFSSKIVYLIAIGIAVYWLSTLMPVFENFIVDIILRSSFIGLLFLLLVYFAKISSDVNSKIEDVLGMGRNL